MHTWLVSVPKHLVPVQRRQSRTFGRRSKCARVQSEADIHTILPSLGPWLLKGAHQMILGLGKGVHERQDAFSIEFKAVSGYQHPCQCLWPAMGYTQAHSSTARGHELLSWLASKILNSKHNFAPINKPQLPTCDVAHAPHFSNAPDRDQATGRRR
jgi:hypothetical protein